MSEFYWASIIFKFDEETGEKGKFKITPTRVEIGNFHVKSEGLANQFKSKDGMVYHNVDNYFYYKHDKEFFGFPVKIKDLLSNAKMYKLSPEGSDPPTLNDYLDNYLQAVKTKNYYLVYDIKEKRIVSSTYSVDMFCNSSMVNFSSTFEYCRSNASNVSERALNRREVLTQMKDVVISQDVQVESLINAVISNQKYAQFEGLKKNVLIIGSTGTGKSLMCRTLAKILEVPIVIKDATKYSTTGFIGDSVINMLRDLYIESGNDLSKTEHGIIVIDEFDKLGENGSDTRNVRTTDVQQELLGLLDGAEYSVEINKDKVVTIDTKNITFILSGAFQHSISDNKHNTIGFNSFSEENKRSQEFIREELAAKGGIEEELLRRLPVIIQMNKLTKEDLKCILTKSKISNLKVWQRAFLEVDNVELVCLDEAVELIAEKAEKIGGGASGLQAIVTETLSDIQSGILDGDISDCEVTVTAQTVEEPSQYLLVKKKGTNYGLSSAYGGYN